MQKGEADVKRQQLMTRIEIDPEVMELIEDMADREGRSKQRQLGMILEAAVPKPNSTPHSSPNPKLAVA